MIETREDLIAAVAADFPHTANDQVRLEKLADAWEEVTASAAQMDLTSIKTDRDAWLSACEAHQRATDAYGKLASTLEIAPASADESGMSRGLEG